MLFYLGEKVDGIISDEDRQDKNKLRRWKYGYSPELDVVIISRDGTLGEIYNIQGLNIGLPEQPPHSKMINHDLPIKDQFWARPTLPYDLTDKGIREATYGLKDEHEIQNAIDILYEKHYDFIEEQFRVRHEGLWVLINGNPIYVPGTYAWGVNWVREAESLPNFRVIQNELMIFWEACKADNRCFGMQYVKNRRMGASLLAIMELLESGSITEDKLLGIISKKGDDAKKIFRRLVNAFKRLPSFFKPVTDGTTAPKTNLVFDEPTRRRKKGERITSGDGLSTIIEWHNTDMNAMDGDAIFRSLIDEAGKYPTQVPFSEYWPIVKTSHRKGVRITGKAMVVSTVNSFKQGGSEYYEVFKDSDMSKRDSNGRTKSGLYRIFIPAKFCLEGMFDEYGFTVVRDPAKPVKTDEGIYTTTGSETWLLNESESLKDDPEKYNEFKRQFPDTIADAFRDSSTDCEFNLVKLQEQIEYNDVELNDVFLENGRDWRGNDLVDRGNLIWKDGVQFGDVVWVPDPDKGRFFIKRGCHPPDYYRNKREYRFENGVYANGPVASELGAFGVDPYNRSKTSDGRGSKGAITLTLGQHTCPDLPKDKMILEYIERPSKVTVFFEDALKAAIYYSIPFLSELSNERFLAYIKDNGFRHYSMNNPFKLYSDLNPTEKEFGGAPQQDTKIGDAQFYATETFVEDHIGVARDDRFRPIGDMGDMPFTRTLYQIKDVDTSNRTEFDAYISFSLSRLGCQRRRRIVNEKPKPIAIPFDRYNNSGAISRIL